MKYKVGDIVEVSKKIAASGYLHEELQKVNYMVTIAEVVDFEGMPAIPFYYATDGTGKHDWFSIWEHHIVEHDN